MKQHLSKDHIRYFVPALLLTIVGFVVAFQFVSPAPPMRITIATGQSTGTYYAVGQKFSAILARDKVTLTVRETSGSVENLRLIADPDSGVDVVLMQGGMAKQQRHDSLVALGSIYHEPLWLFHRSNLPVSQLKDLKGSRLSVGLAGSGTSALTTQLLALNGIGEENSRIIHASDQEAEQWLMEGTIDAAFFVSGKLNQTVERLLRTHGIDLFSFRRGEAYTRRLHYLSCNKLPEGVIDFEQNIPGADIFLIGPTAQLVARKDLHPALIDLLLLAAGEVGADGGLFEKPNEFPMPKYVDFPLSTEAKRFYTSGQRFLRRYLPFWLANFLIRMKIMLLPLVALLLPLVKLLPPIYQWRIRSRIFRWYDQILEIDFQMLHGDADADSEQFLSRLAWIEQEVSRITVPRGYYRELYDMRMHIEMLRDKLVDAGAVERCPPPPESPITAT